MSVKIVEGRDGSGHHLSKKSLVLGAWGKECYSNETSNQTTTDDLSEARGGELLVIIASFVKPEQIS